MKKRRKVASSLDEKIHLGYHKESPEGNVTVQCDQVTCPYSSERPAPEALHHYQELPPSPDQRTLLSSLQYNKNLLKYLNDDRQKQPSFCDLLIIVEGKEFSAHKVVVAVGSSYFHACLSKNPSTDVVTLDHVTHSVFQHLLEFLYTSEFFVYKYEIPLVLEAAKFLDIIDAVKLLNNENVAAFQAELTEKSSPEETLNELTGRLSNNHQCKFCSRHFCYKKSLENHLTKAHRSLLLGKKHGLKMLERSFSARRSKRNRKCPVKFDDTSEDEPESADGSDNLNQESFDKEKSDRNDSEDAGSEYNAEEDELEEEMSDEYSDIEEQSDRDNEAEEEPEAGDSVGNIHEGLTPVIIQNSNKKILQCPKCDKTFDRIGKYESHTRVHTGEKPFECDICHQRYSTKSNLTVHRKKHSNETEFHKKEHKCPYCNKLHASKKTLAKHVKRFHPENAQEFISIKKSKSESWKCDICKKSFTRRPHLEEHMILHSQDKPFKCTYCEEHFKSRFARLKHQEKFHLDLYSRNDLSMCKCDYSFLRDGWEYWAQLVRKEKCLGSHRYKANMGWLNKEQFSALPHYHACSFCIISLMVSSVFLYRLHLRVHHDDKRYECDECGKTFIRHDHLTKHKKIHSGEKAHQCEECGKCFGRRDHLTVHYKSVHLGEKVWQKYKATFHQCDVCKKIFKGKSSLEMHFRTHSGEKPYKCQICNQSFRIKKTLTKHLVIHSDARPFNCQHCNATFKRKDKLKYHIDHVHGIKSPDDPLSTSEEKLVSLPVEYSSDDKIFQTETKQYLDQPKVYQSEAKTLLQNVSAEVCVPVTLVPVQMPDTPSGLVQHTTTLPPASHEVLPPQPQSTDYPRAADLAFLEKYTLTPQPANIVHPVRPEQMLDPREQSYLGTLLGLDNATAVQNISSGDHHS
ncbi:PREDICTED: zinc finger and BTB domain-containing protein 41 [Dipodomys ordii]|uniref:Zinc finger and BTB domain-containing protein 41 n=1 Tax=Dipodomys ordii TaxID=10020 RepID=A0A1S3F877_DIPOR|nr:PREDICTED: zinc finger and BTB domain-containing protein 41 [Dipodomys ordii]